jgi:hypothetical protein
MEETHYYPFGLTILSASGAEDIKIPNANFIKPESLC